MCSSSKFVSTLAISHLHAPDLDKIQSEGVPCHAFDNAVVHSKITHAISTKLIPKAFVASVLRSFEKTLLEKQDFQ
jgi:hypothetical protein